jgi:hypothetical protein
MNTPSLKGFRLLVPPTGAHMTEEQITDCVIHGAPLPDLELHLISCPPCGKRLAVAMTEFNASVTNFSHASLAWTEARPEASLRVEARRQSLSSSSPLGWALAVASLLVVAVPAWQHGHHSPRVIEQSAIAGATPPDSDAQIASDDRMLQQVDVALDDETPSPFRDYGLTPGARSTLPSQAETR